LGNYRGINQEKGEASPAIVFNPQVGLVKIIDFGISTRINQLNPTLKHPNVLEGTLAYISPEQTGRMNRFLHSCRNLGLGSTQSKSGPQSEGIDGLSGCK